LALMNSKLTQSLSMHNLATGFGSDSDTSGQLILSLKPCDNNKKKGRPCLLLSLDRAYADKYRKRFA
jgi:hypothetical protein